MFLAVREHSLVLFAILTTPISGLGRRLARSGSLAGESLVQRDETFFLQHFKLLFVHTIGGHPI